jgi:hypothetical protein
MADRYIPPVTIADGDRISAATIAQWQRNSNLEFHTMHGWPSRWFNASETPTISSTLFNLPNTIWHPRWQGAIQKTGRRNQLNIPLRWALSAGQVFSIRVLVNFVERWSTSGVTGTGSTTVTLDLSSYGITPGAIYFVFVDIQRTSGSRTPQYIVVDNVRGRDPSVPAGWPSPMPTFWTGTPASSATDLVTSDLNTIVLAQRWLYDRMREVRLPGFSGYQELDRTHLDLADGWVVLRNGTMRKLSGRNILTMWGRLAPTGNQQLRLVANGAVVWTGTYNGAAIQDPWYVTADMSSAITALSTGAEFPVELQFLRTSERPPQQVATRYSLWSLQAEQALAPTAYQPTQEPNAAVRADLRPGLQKITDNLSAAYSAWQAAAPVVDQDLPLAWQWEAAAAWDRHIVGGQPAGGMGLDPERQGDKLRFPASFVRWGDALEVRGRNVILHWGPFTPDPNEPRKLKFAYTQQLTEGEQDVTTTVFLDGISGPGGARVPRGQTYHVTADRLLYAAERVYDPFS